MTSVMHKLLGAMGNELDERQRHEANKLSKRLRRNVGKFGRDLTHLRTLLIISVTATSEHDDHAATRVNKFARGDQYGT